MRIDALTPMEQGILVLVAAGYMSEAIALHMKISLRMVKFHRSNILRKSSSTTTVEMIGKFYHFVERSE